MGLQELCDTVCIVGVGDTKQGAVPDKTGDELAREAARRRQRAALLQKHAKRVGLQRNVCVALGNIGDAAAIPALAKALRSDSDIVRLHAAWALGRIGGNESKTALHSALADETDAAVINEIRLTLEEIDAS